MQVYQTNDLGVFVGTAIADADPLVPGNFLIPAGCVETPPPTIPSGKRARWTGAIWLLEFDDTLPAAPPQAAAPTSQNVDEERDFRIAAGKTFTLSGYGDVRITGRDVDMRNLVNLALGAQLRIAGGAGAVTTNFRDADNVIHALTQPQILDLWSQGSAYVSAIYAASWAIKDAGPIPSDYNDPARWP